MSPLVSETAIPPINPTIISAEVPYISVSPVMQDVIVANDTNEQTGKRSLLERRRKRLNRRSTH